MARKAASNRNAKKPAASRREAGTKVGSSPKSAKKFGGKLDFGVKEKPRLREYTRRISREAKFQPGGSHSTDPRQEIGAAQAARVSGVGKPNAGPGGASGGDLDPDIVGVGDGRGVSQGGPDAHVAGPEWSTGGSEEMASGPPARGENQGKRGRPRPAMPPGSTVNRGDEEIMTGGSGSAERTVREMNREREAGNRRRAPRRK